ncbi:MAG: dipeptide ABC transporter ATP-binding protein [Pseudomonadota bacterium]
MSLLTIETLSVAIHSHQILKDISLAIAPGEIVALTGESGSGKSMTALATMQLLPKGATTEGQITLGDQELTRLPEKTLCTLRGNEMSMVFQEPMTALNPVHPIGLQVAEALRVHDPAMTRMRAEERAAEVLHRVGLSADQIPPSRFPHELSGGQRQRVVIAIAIARRPKLLIADEPTTALDVTTQAQILSLLKRLVAEDAMSLMMITHDLAVVADMADRIIVMQHGQIVEQGPTAQLLRVRAHPYTQMLFQASSHAVQLPQTQTGKTLIEARGVVREYKLPRKNLFDRPQWFRALNDVSFAIRKGERLGLVGESGCGKSTLTRALLGLEPVQAGSILFDGQQVFTENRPNVAVRRRMQVVFQDPFGSFNPRHRVDRLITEPLHLLSTPPQGADRQRAIDAALTAVGLTPQDAQKYIHEFSGGQRQRIAIARALIIRPDLIVFDEAVSALDVSVRAQILDLLADLCHAYALTYLFISHDLSVVRTITDRVLVMRAGEIVEEGPTQRVFDTPMHAYTKELIAAAPRLTLTSETATG